MGQEKKRKKYYLLYTGLFVVMCAVAFFPFFVEGKSFVWGAGVEDGLSQHFSALAYWGRYLRELVGNLLSGHLKLPMWDLSIGYGADIISTLNYYAIGDPLNILYGFISPKNTETMYNFMILLRMYLAGIAFMMYAGKMKKKNYASVMGALVYVFCGFSFRLGLRHPFFLNPMIYFPLLCLGIEKIYRKEKPFAFIITVAVAAVSNYYFLYMLTIFSVVYAWIRFYDYYKEERVRNFFLTVRTFVLYYVTGIALSAAILLPSVIGFLGNGRHGGGVDLRTLIVYPAKYYVLFIENLMAYGNAGNNTNAGYLPIAGIAILFVLFSQRMKHKKYRITFLGCIIGLALPVFGFALNGFSYASNRWSFVLNFVAALLTTEMYPRFFCMSKRQKRGIGGSILIYNLFILIVNCTKEKTLENKGAQTAGIILFVFYLCFLFFQWKGYDRKSRVPQVVMALLTVVTIGVHGHYRFGTDHGNYTNQFMDAGASLKTLQSKQVKMLSSVEDDSVHRVHAEGYKYKNYGLVNQLNTISGYYSITSGDVTDAVNSYQTLGMQYADKYRGLDQRTGLMSLAGVKYMTISDEGHVDRWTDSKGDIPYGFKKIKQDGKVSLYKNKYALPLAYAYDSYITKNQYQALNGVGREQAMLESVVLEDKPSMKYLKNRKVADNTSVDTIALSENRISSPKGEKYSIVTVPVDTKKEMYLYFKELTYDDSRVKNNNFLLEGKKSSKGILVEQNDISKKIYIQSTFSPYYFGRKDYMIKLNHSQTKGKEKVKLDFLSPGTYQFEELYLVTVDKQETINKINQLKKSALTDIKYEGNHFSAKIDTKKEKMVCVTIPYSKGWSAKVDGKQAKVYKANGMYMGIQVEKGKHNIELNYVSPGFKEGTAVSIVAILFVIGLSFYYRRR